MPPHAPADIRIELLALLGPIISALFSIAFFGLWHFWRRFRYLLWLAVSSLLFTIGALAEIFLIPSNAGLNILAWCFLYTLGIVVFHEACLMRLNLRPLRWINACICLLIMLGTGYFYYIHDSFFHRLYMQFFGWGMLYLVVTLQMRQAVKRTADQIMFWAFLVFGCEFFLWIGILLLHHVDRTGPAFLNSPRYILLSFVLISSAVLIGLWLVVTVTTDMVEHLRARASTDALTGLLNRRGFEEAARDIFANPALHPVCLLVCDIDHFKSINDTFGHAAGDAVLREFAQLLRAKVRRFEIVGRIGGEEFALLLTKCDRTKSLFLAERIRVAAANTQFEKVSKDWRITASFGLAELRPEESLLNLLERADGLLYTAKRTGRNRIVTEATDTKESSSFNRRHANDPESAQFKRGT